MTRRQVVGPYTLGRRLHLHHPLASIEFWDATSTPDNERVLCVLPRRGAVGLAAADDWLAAFEADLEDAARLDHPAVLRVRKRGRIESVPFAELEPFSGVTLRDAWPERGLGYGLPPLAAVAIVARLAEAVHHLYATALDRGEPNAVVHLSDGLVLCGADGRVHLLPRFSRVYEEEMPSFVDFPRVLGIPPADAHPSVRGLVFWLGSVLYYLAVGDLTTGLEAWRDIERLTAEFPVPSRADPRLSPLDAVVAKATHRKPAYRFEDPGRFAAALADILQTGLQDGAYRSPPWTAERARSYLADRAREALAAQR